LFVVLVLIEDVASEELVW